MRGGGRLAASALIMLAIAGAAIWGFSGANLRPQLGLDLVGGVSLTLTAPPGTDSEVVDKTLEVIRNRVDQFGVAEPDITRQGELNILVQIPQAETGSQERLLELIGQTARLEFRIVEEAVAPGTPEYDELQVTAEGEDGATEPSAAPTPAPSPGAEEETADEQQQEQEEEAEGEVVYLGSGEDRTKYRLGPVQMTGEALRDARAVFNDPAAVTDPGSSGWVVSFRLNGEGAETFARITRENTNRQLAIVLDERVESAPNINEEIAGGEGQISGNFQEQEAKDLALVLRTGALPIELQREELRTVSPTLGRESLRQGLLAGVAGLIALAIYLFFYYRVLGVVTWFGMAIWATLTLAIVSLLGRTVGYSLTLAGVAGLVVSVGVAADSYVVFYERLKDEVRRGKTLRAAVGPAFTSAWRTIVAANLVTIAAAVILYLVAVGAVRGFALTLGLATFLDLIVMFFFKRPTVFLIARSRRLSEMRGMGLRSGVAADPDPVPVRGGSR
ncbi:MAG TPA: protein translocase subunit SecD [Actinomycetota bacterium]|nr:protein translocase subunit SecD [Actinomycetota bacterium]